MELETGVLTIGNYLAILNSLLKPLRAKIIGEVTQLKFPNSGHVYFTLKDKETGAILECVIWKSNYQLSGIQLKSGMEIIASGHPEVYPQWGKLSFYAQTIELVGEGALKKAYDLLKRKLTAEGLFAPENKRPLPAFPQKIGIITSKQGAVIHDFMNNTGKYGFAISFIDSRVEGKEALIDLLAAIRTMRKRDLDVLVIMRGGGSLQSLAAFDNEMIVRELAGFPVPVIAAIGHHQDVPLAALASDIQVSTPTAAANLINSSWDNATATLDHATQKILMHYHTLLRDVAFTIEMQKQKLYTTFQSLINIVYSAKQLIKEYMIGIDATLPQLHQQLTYTTSAIMTQFARATLQAKDDVRHIPHVLDIFPALARIDVQLQNIWKTNISSAFLHLQQYDAATIEQQQKIISAHNPTRLLNKGYSIIMKNNIVVKTIKNVTIGEEIGIMLADGIVTSVPKTIKKTHYDE